MALQARGHRRERRRRPTIGRRAGVRGLPTRRCSSTVNSATTSGDGTMSSPFRSLRHGVDAADGRDVYVRSFGHVRRVRRRRSRSMPRRASTAATTPTWLRDVAARTSVRRVVLGLSYVDAAVVDRVGARHRVGRCARRRHGGGRLVGRRRRGDLDRRQRIAAGSGGAAPPATAGSSSVAVSVADVGALNVVRSTITGGAAGTGGAGTAGAAARRARSLPPAGRASAGHPRCRRRRHGRR